MSRLKESPSNVCLAAERANRVMRSAPINAGLTVTARGLLHPWLRHLDRQMRGDCLIVTARAGGA
jgi:hypothetical protein